MWKWPWRWGWPEAEKSFEEDRKRPDCLETIGRNVIVSGDSGEAQRRVTEKSSVALGNAYTITK